MQGRRIQPDENGWFSGKLEPGDYVRLDPKCMQDGTPLQEQLRVIYPYWIGCCPNGNTCSLARHQIIEHEDGTITVSPSILISRGGHGSGKPIEELWHGFLERGVWRTV